MCASSETTLKGKAVSVYMGYYGGSLSVGNKTFSVNAKGEPTVSEEEMIGILAKHKAKDLARMIVELVRDSEE